MTLDFELDGQHFAALSDSDDEEAGPRGSAARLSVSTSGVR
jgi:hypothetical protein